MSDFLFDRLYSGLNNVLDIRSQQHALSATNLANAETPGYKARFIPFDQVLEDAVMSTDSMAMNRSESAHFVGTGTVLNPGVEEIEAPPWAENGNSVFAEREMARLTSNSMLYGALTRGISTRLSILRYAASDGKS
jgi:flagellar basal-body rod protein FlgB